MQDTKARAAAEGLLTFREYAESTGVSYESVRKKVENHQKIYEQNRKTLDILKREAEADPEDEEKRRRYEFLADTVKEQKRFCEGVVQIGGAKYLDEAARTYLDRQRKETVLAVPDTHTKEALAISKGEADALRKKVIDLQEMLLQERTAKLEDLKSADNETIENIIKRLDDQARQIDANKAEIKALQDRIGELTEEVQKSRKKGIFGRYRA